MKNIGVKIFPTNIPNKSKLVFSFPNGQTAHLVIWSVHVPLYISFFGAKMLCD